MFALCEDWAPDHWQAAVVSEGLEVAMTATEMVADRLLPPRRPLPELKFHRTDNEKTAMDLAHVNAYAYQMPLPMMECICNLYLWREPSYGYVGYLNDEPVTCAATFPVDSSRRRKKLHQNNDLMEAEARLNRSNQVRSTWDTVWGAKPRKTSSPMSRRGCGRSREVLSVAR